MARKLLAALVLLLGIPANGAAEILLPPDPAKAIGGLVSFDGFVDENGKAFDAAGAEEGGRPWIVSPMYTRCPHTCSAITAGLKRAIEGSALEPADYRVLSFSFDPAEKGESLRAFRERLRLPDEWVTIRAADEDSLQRTLASLDFRTVETADGQFQHPNLVAVLTPDRKLAGYLFGVSPSPGELASLVRSARSGVSRTARWQTLIFFFAAVGFLLSAFVFVMVIFKRRVK